MNRTTQQTPATVKPWGRGRLIVAAAGAGLVFALLLTGLGLALIGSFTGNASAARQVADGMGVRDRIASEPMRALPRQAAAQGAPALVQLEPIRVPEPSVLRGPAGVPTGFPRTPEGAVGQLAALEVAVFEAMDLDYTRSVHTEWTQPGAVGFDGWVVTRGVQAFLAASKQSGDRKPDTTLIQARPAAGLVKGTDGADWVLACVLLDVRAVQRTQGRVGFGHCEPMSWAGDRWLIAEGTRAAAATSAWPGSQDAVDAGWLPWVVADAVEVTS